VIYRRDIYMNSLFKIIIISSCESKKSFNTLAEISHFHLQKSK